MKVDSFWMVLIVVGGIGFLMEIGGLVVCVLADALFPQDFDSPFERTMNKIIPLGFALALLCLLVALARVALLFVQR